MSTTLTRRERRVKKILLNELERMNEWNRLTYSEKKYLDKTLDVAFLDRELAKMRKQLRTVRRFEWPAWLVAIALTASGIWMLAAGEINLVFLLGPIWAAGYSVGKRSLIRKMFIYEALRELSDADELDVQLSRVAVEADALIEQIVAREMKMDLLYPSKTLASVRRN